ncbi:MAG: 3-hydroxyacyl-CoA dehydrogenase NAD-binding domain-containing protein, partial [Steroidobacteraceae bacterium]|nr:3-hydroxyacyl-CoA dehydrogenase NAD-binding domain-containing protein [Steroidobacteraceae bacterium]MDW8260343.1 3-hydroxyacyl-CoA dehydrogenase NAD-binding domain-containing protein [Gammaproteobacteria bacterium]
MSDRTYETIELRTAADGIATLIIDDRKRSMNVLGAQMLSELADVVAAVRDSNDIRGLILTSGQPAFLAGADLEELLQQFARRLSLAQAAAEHARFSRMLRQLETVGKPVVAAINGLALGGGFEMCLACHRRILVDEPRAQIGLPEVTVGLLPGGGGTQRLPRLIGIEKALPLLLEGRSLRPREALQLGLVDAVVPSEQLLAAARDWLLSANAFAQQPWDRKGFTVPGGAQIAVPAIAQLYMATTAAIARGTQRNYPAPIAILSAVFEGCQLPIDRGLAVELRYFAQLITDPTARNLIRTVFVNKRRAEKLIRRPPEIPRSQVRRLGVLGAGMMGAGIACVAARAGINCVLIDRTQELADRGRQAAVARLRRDVEKGTLTQGELEAVLGRIMPTTDYARLGDCELVIEAVFEDRAVKCEVAQRAETVLSSDAIIASNTSTLPISGLAAATRRQERFIGMHFFSPVERMPLVEIIVGRRTSTATLARALDFVAQLRKTPIVVNDSRNFYTSRVFGVYCHEGRALLEEGVDPALIENVARAAGMPVGPLAVADEVSLELQWQALQQSRADLGADFVEPVGSEVLRRMVVDLRRMGRKSGAGFYEYPPNERKFLWHGLATEFPRARSQPSAQEV